MLYLVATPIGNLEDLTYRAVRVLAESDYILCEDTRHSRVLLNHYDIKKPLKAYHKFCERKHLESILDDLESDKNICLISDAGTPGISDPGQLLVSECLKRNIPVVAIPGPCAAIAALSISGLDTSHFQFVGFLPKKASELKAQLVELLRFKGTSVCYESPKRLKAVLQALYDIAPDRNVAVGRELTKRFEELIHGTVTEVLEHFNEGAIKGEIVLLISGDTTESSNQWESLSVEEHVLMMQQQYELSKSDAIKMVSQLRGVPKKDVYNKVHDL